MIGKLIFMFIGCVGFALLIRIIEKIIGVDFGLIPFVCFGIVWGSISENVLETLQKHGFFK